MIGVRWHQIHNENLNYQYELIFINMGVLLIYETWVWVTEFPAWWWSNTYVWGWKSFNPTENLVYWGWQPIYPSILWSSNSYNLSGVNAWTETFLALIVAEWPISTLSFQIINPLWQIIASYSYGWVWSFQWVRYWAWIWLRHWEIEMNGTYICRVTMDWIEYDINVVISWITNQLDRHESWYFWVEWDNLAFIDGCNYWSTSKIWYKHLIDHDWVIYSTWKTPWFTRIPETWHGKIAYIDSSWNERRTRLADSIWVPYDWSSLPQSWKTPWYIWVADIWQFHWTYLFFVWNDWKVYRISHWSPFWY